MMNEKADIILEAIPPQAHECQCEVPDGKPRIIDRGYLPSLGRGYQVYELKCQRCGKHVAHRVKP